MRNATGPLDILLLVPFEPVSSFVIEPHVRQDFAVAYTSLMQAAVEFGEYLGCDLPVQPTIGAPPPRFALRSLSAITLATHLEREGLDWAALDPGEQDLGAWRRDLERFRGAPPRTIAVCTTFLIGGRWPSVLLSMLRELFPDSKILLGGYFYATDSQAFLSLDADVYCVGEGELRLPAIVKAILAGRTLDDIPGLYLRQGGGALRYTGPVEQLDLGALPPVDWTLAGSERMEPRLDPERDSVAMGVETQRGCVFKCEFCTYRTLIGPNVMAPEAAVDAIMRCSVVKHGYIALVDATGTFPHDRWEEILYRLIARGGAPHPIWMYGRVSDLSERTAALMARAGVTAVFVGQESGDQRILHAMKKGTRTSQIRPAVAALGKHGIVGQFGFIHGFPGEDDESLRNTRHVMATLNDGFERRPVVLVASVGPMHHQDLSASGYKSRAEHKPDSVWRDTWNRLFANPAQFPQRPGGWGHAVIETYMMLSRIPHAPAWDIFHGGDPRDQLHISFYASPHRHEIFRWTKAVQRGVAIFLEQRWEGKQPDAAELSRLRGLVFADLAPRAIDRTLRARAGRALRTALLRRLVHEFRSEADDGYGGLTRALAVVKALKDTGHLRSAAQAWQTTTTMPLGAPLAPQAAQVEDLARDLVDQAMSSSQRWRSERKRRLPVVQPDKQQEAT